ncbi:hypothetical protein G7Y89_g14259 [Cudoniella acicularis]|uniref:Heterokaryon incompatibility domain-containing protein n=1 Tax=Cudoniella acicularis TaxID=354080 RepID=A0A8H4VU85_9HELO|nr:hypothetical protein G7Y89_g14259 [Cudoniella acicularis]
MELLRSANRGCPLCSLIIRKDQIHRSQDSYLDDLDENSDSELRDPQIYISISGDDSGEEQVLFIEQCLEGNDGRNLAASRLLMSLSIYAEPDDPAAINSIITGRPVSPLPLSDATYAMIKNWFKTCGESHLACEEHVTKPLPTRVIDVGSIKGGLSEKIFVSKGKCADWVALSHCWGGVIQKSTTTTNLQDREQLLIVEELPKNFRNAIEITRWLGYRYLWIDSLCILQDSHEDWVREATQMANVYKHAVVTIAAESAMSSETGILRERNTDAGAIAIPYCSLSQGIEGKFYIRELSYGDEIHPLQQRAWTLQEVFLSPRVLHFTNQQIIWSCHTTSLPESNPAHTRPILQSIYCWKTEDRKSEDSILSLWYSLLNDYSYRRLTYSNDSLLALSAIAKETQELTGFTYKAGIWEEDMHRGLLWSVGGLGVRSSECSLPSWSWASLDFSSGQPEGHPFYIHLGDSEARIATFDATFERCDVIEADEGAYGRVLSGRLAVVGQCQAIADVSKRSKPYFLKGESFSLADVREGDIMEQIYLLRSRLPFSRNQTICDIDDLLFRAKVGWTSRPRCPLHNHTEEANLNVRGTKFNAIESGLVQEDKSIIYLQISKWTGFWGEDGVLFALILEPTGLLDEYRRIGVAQIPEDNGIAEVGWKRQRLYIV